MQSTLLLKAQDCPSRCSACDKRKNGKERSKIFLSADSLRAHISTVHSLWKPYECMLCPMVFLPTERLLQYHYERTHPGSVPKAIYTYVEGKKAEIERVFLESQIPFNVGHNSEAKPAAVQRNKSAEVDHVGSLPKEKESEKCISDTEEEEEIALEIEKEENELNREITGTDEGTVDDSETNFEHQPTSDLEEGEEVTSGVEDEAEANLDAATKGGTPKIDKPSRQTRLKSNNKWCNLCQDTIGPSTMRNAHIWSDHMGTCRRFHCKVCKYKTSITNQPRAHSQRVHKMPSANGWVDHTAALTPQYERQYELAFGYKRQTRKLCHLSALSQTSVFQPPSNKKRPQPPKIQCQLCGTTVCESKRKVHLWVQHMDRHRYTCRRLICDYGTSQNVEIMRKHVRSTGHGNADDECCWKDNTQALSGEFEQKHVAAYGMRSSCRPK